MFNFSTIGIGKMIIMISCIILIALFAYAKAFRLRQDPLLISLSQKYSIG